MTTAAPALQTAMMAASDLATGGVPEWVHLLPVSAGMIQTNDKRGPYKVEDAAAIIAASFADQTKLQIDENHAEDLASTKGEPSPARGWITALEARADGIWGRVEWTRTGYRLVRDKAYRAMSPVILHEDKTNKVFAILRASLVNRPNFRGLAALNQEQSMSFMAKLAEALGLSEGASEDDAVTAIKALKDKKPEGEAAMQSALAEIGVAFGLATDAKPDTIAAAAKLAKSGTADIVALESELATVKTELTTLKTAGTRSASESFIDKAIADRRAGVNAGNREDLIALHMAQKDQAEKLILGMPMLNASGALTAPPVQKDGTVSLNAEQIAVCAALGVSQADFLKTLAEEKR